MKILVLLGTQPQPFKRLIDELEVLMETGTITGEVVIQSGHTLIDESLQRNATIFKFLDKSGYTRHIERADIVITHGGAGSIFDALERKKIVIAIPRLAEFGEHVDDHQLELVEKLSDLKYIIGSNSIKNALESIDKEELIEYKSNKEIAKNILHENI